MTEIVKSPFPFSERPKKLNADLTQKGVDIRARGWYNIVVLEGENKNEMLEA